MQRSRLISNHLDVTIGFLIGSWNFGQILSMSNHYKKSFLAIFQGKLKLSLDLFGSTLIPVHACKSKEISFTSQCWTQGKVKRDLSWPHPTMTNYESNDVGTPFLAAKAVVSRLSLVVKICAWSKTEHSMSNGGTKPWNTYSLWNNRGVMGIEKERTIQHFFAILFSRGKKFENISSVRFINEKLRHFSRSFTEKTTNTVC